VHRTTPKPAEESILNVPYLSAIGSAISTPAEIYRCYKFTLCCLLELATPEQLADLRARLSFARIGLQQLTLGDDELTARLLRSVSLNLTTQDRRETIILNAKSLLDLDADARFFAARILLSYIYEETLPWKVADGPQALKEAHRRAFVDYIPRGIAL
jgi:ribonucleoside-diphosphate reductase alpha chain